MTELELIAAAKKGNRRAADRLIRMHRGFLLTVAKKYKIQGFDFDDNLQLCRIGLLEAIHLFDPKRECKLITLAIHRIRKQFDVIIKTLTAKKRYGVTVSLYQELPETDLILSDTIPEVEQETEIDLEPLLQAVRTIQKRSERVVMEMFIDGFICDEPVSLQEIGARLNLCKERVRQLRVRAVQRPAFQRLRNELKN